MSRLPAIVCPKCGELKLPKQRCQDCYKSDWYYHGQKVKLESTRKILEERRERKKQAKYELTKDYKRKVGYNKQSRHARAYQRAISVAQFEQLTRRILKCFEKDRQGEWELYQDRMPELRQCIELGYGFLEREKKRRKQNSFPASGLKAGKDSFFD